ncbi:MAG: hypothetical protein IPG10_06355 [Flavobacteriales bacterium]|nr:hypothetical protein [Flavobacteriales bacterium]
MAVTRDTTTLTVNAAIDTLVVVICTGASLPARWITSAGTLASTPTPSPPPPVATASSPPT